MSDDQYEEVVEVDLAELIAQADPTGKLLSSAKTADPGPVRCSFCRSSQLEVRLLIGGPDGYICDRCVYSCLEIVESEGVGPPPVDPETISHIAHPEPPETGR